MQVWRNVIATFDSASGKLAPEIQEPKCCDHWTLKSSPASHFVLSQTADKVQEESTD